MVVLVTNSKVKGVPTKEKFKLLQRNTDPSKHDLFVTREVSSRNTVYRNSSLTGRNMNSKGFRVRDEF